MAIDDENIENEIVTMHSVQSQRLRLMKKKLILAKALKSLRKLIMLSKLKGDDESGESSSESLEDYYDDNDGRVSVYSSEYSGSTIMPWWARSNSHGRRRRKRRRKKRYDFWYDVFN